MRFTSPDGKENLVEFSYPWLPTRCSKCEKWGHLATVCRLNEEGDVVTHTEKNIQKDTPITGVETVFNPMVMESSIVVDIGTEDAREEVTTNAMLENSKKDKEEGEWSTPTKTGRSPDKKGVALEYGQVSILSSSRFAVLSDNDQEETEDIELEQEKQAEVTVTNERLEEGLRENQIAVSMEEEGVKEVRQDTVARTRQSLQRLSKDNHKVLSVTTNQTSTDANPSGLNKRSTRTKP